VETAKIFFCPACGHEFCSIHKDHREHAPGPKSRVRPADTAAPAREEKKPLNPVIVAAFLVVIALVIGAFLAVGFPTLPPGDPVPPVTTAVTTTLPTPAPTTAPAPAPTWDSRRAPVTGTILAGNGTPPGKGRLFIENLLGKGDAIVALTSFSTTTPLAAVYIGQGQNYTFSGIGDGFYNLYVYSGRDWSIREKRFLTNPEYYKFSDSFIFFTITTTRRTAFEEVRETRVSTFNVTLYSVANGTAKAVGVPKENFPAYG
jgi:hypothetical protein